MKGEPCPPRVQAVALPSGGALPEPFDFGVRLRELGGELLGVEALLGAEALLLGELTGQLHREPLGFLLARR